MKRREEIIRFFGPVIGLLLVVAAGNEEADCTQVPEPDVDCTTPVDCEGLPHDLCLDGEWECIDGECSYHCGMPPLGCSSDGECPAGQHCSVSDGECGPHPDCYDPQSSCPGVCYGKCVDDEPGCVQSGCSGEVCADEAVYTTCIWKAWFDCLQYTQCDGFGPGGSCGFDQNQEFLDCILSTVCSDDPDCPQGYYCGIPGCEDIDQCPITVAPTCIPKGMPNPCKEEGGQFTDFDIEGKCCEGLTPIPDCKEDEIGGCACPNCPCFVCTWCGNGKCGTGENTCNCPEDCTVTPQCTADVDCHDGDDCTDDECVNGICKNESVPGCPTECVKEGEIGSSMMTPMECCPGLKAIAVATWDPVNGFCGMASDIFLCSKCGNGTCESDWENPCNCSGDCKVDPVDPMALCEATGGQWVGCGSGCGPWSCGEPFQMICPGVCISQCECGDGMGWDPQKGCMSCTCSEWWETWKSLLAQVAQCSSASDCIDVPGTSCGCTRNLVVNKDVDLWFFWKVAGWMGDDGCSPFVSTCDCPSADGFACVDGLCSWNYFVPTPP